MLVADEAHHLGTAIARNGLLEDYVYRLALSATIERYFDQDGTDFLREYFKGSTGVSSVASYPLEKAIKEDKLCGYNYYPFFTDLTEDEYHEYRSITHKAARLLSSTDFEKRKKGEGLIKMRAKIIRDATNKPAVLEKILAQMPKIKHLLIFCSEKQYDTVEKILSNSSKHRKDNRTTMFRKITYDNPKLKKDRVKILDGFANEDWDVLLSNRVLDEGMDIPQARSCIVMASTGNPTQFIQRRGRVLRPYSEPYLDGSRKTHADIYDILIKPQIDKFADRDSIRLEISMIRNQFSRIKNMSELALNKPHCMNEIKKFTYGLPAECFSATNK